MARIDYLTETEQKRFEMTPEFTSSNERNYFFNLPNAIYSQAILLENDEAFATFALMFGYFKASNKFFEKKGVKKRCQAPFCLESDEAFAIFALMFGYFKASNKFFEKKGKKKVKKVSGTILPFCEPI